MPLDIKFQLNKISQNKLLIIYKLIHDALFILIIFFIFAMIGEGLLPGIVSAHLGLYKILVVIALNILAIKFVSLSLNLNSQEPLNKKAASFLLFVLIFLFMNSLRNLDIFLNLIIIVTTVCIFYFLYKTTFSTSA